MDSKTLRPSSRGQGSSRSPQPATAAPTRVFNCIVDETALIQGAKKSTRDGIPKWIAAGRLRLFVPLYALNQASRVKASKGRAATDAGEALEWLDEATSEYPQLVTLQGGYDKFETWAEVEKFAIPRASFSEDDHLDIAEPVASLEDLRLTDEPASKDLAEATGVNCSFSSNDSTVGKSTVRSDQSLRSLSPPSPPITPPKSEPNVLSQKSDQKSPRQPAKGTKEASCVPRNLQPLFNYILWRVHQESNPAAALNSFIFLSDNANMRKHAQKFGIRSKTLQEIRMVIARESQDDRNRQMVNRKTQPKTDGNSAPQKPKVTPEKVPDDELGGSVSDEEEILLKRAPKAPAAMVNGGASPVPLMDPNQFRRSPNRAPAQPRGQGRGQRTRGSSTNRGRGSSQPQRPVEPIDPDSFARPASSRGGARGGRGLWTPT